MSEEWRPVPGYAVEASDLGRVRRHGEDPVETRPDYYGYHRVTVLNTERGINEQKSIHHLVSLAFHGPMPQGLERLHLDGNPGNNRPDNIRYGTHTENMNGPKRNRSKHASGRDVVQLVRDAAAAMKELPAASLDTRPALIRVARAGGITWPDIAEAAGVSRVTAINLAKVGAPETP